MVCTCVNRSLYRIISGSCFAPTLKILDFYNDSRRKQFSYLMSSIYTNPFESLVVAAEDAEMFLPPLLESVPPTDTFTVSGFEVNPLHTAKSMALYLKALTQIKSSSVKLDFISLYARAFTDGFVCRQFRLSCISDVEESFLLAFAERNRMRPISKEALILFKVFVDAANVGLLVELVNEPNLADLVTYTMLASPLTLISPSSFIKGETQKVEEAMSFLKMSALFEATTAYHALKNQPEYEVVCFMISRMYKPYADDAEIVFQSGDGRGLTFDSMLGNLATAISLPSVISAATGSVSDDVSSVAAKMLDTLTAVDSSIESVQQTASEAKSFIDSFKQTLSDVLKLITVDNLLTVFTKYICPLVLAVLAIFQFPSTTLRVLASFCAAGALYAHGPSILRLINLRSEFSTSQGVEGLVQETGEVQFQSKLGDLPRLITTLLTPIFNVDPSKVDSVKTAIEQLTREPIQVVNHVTAVVKLVEKVTFLWSTLKRYIGWASTGFETLNSGYQDVDEFNKRCMAIFKQQELIPTRDTRAEVSNLLAVCARLKVKYVKETAVYKLVDQFTSQLLKADINLARVDFTGKPFRAEPVCVGLYGPPGLGKSTADEIIADRLVRYDLRHSPALLDLYSKNPDDFIFVRRNSDYWEGVRQHVSVLRYPDYLAGKAEITGTKHETELIDLISTEKYTPNMAFEQKGKLSLAPSYITLSTNEMSIRGSTVNHKDALARRFRLYRLEWAGPVNSKGLMAPELGAPLDISHWKFVPGQCNATYAFEPTGESAMTLDEVVCAAIIERDLNIKKASSIALAKHSAAQTTASVYEMLEDYDFQSGKSIHAQVKALAPKIKTVKPVLYDSEETILSVLQAEEYQDVPLDMKKRLTVLHTYVGVIDDEAYYNRLRVDAPKLYAAAILRPTLLNRTKLITNNTLTTLSEKFVGFFEIVKKTVCSIDLRVVPAILTLLGSAAAAYYFFNKEDEAVEVIIPPVLDYSLAPQSKNYVDTAALARAKAAQAKLRTISKFKPVEIVAQAAEHIKVGISKARDHTYQVFSNDGSLFTCFLALGKKDFLMNYHAYRSMLQAYESDFADFELKIKHATRPMFVASFLEIQGSAMIEEATDMVFFRLKNGPDMPNILPHWAPDKFIGDRIHKSYMHTSIGFLLPSASGPQYCQQARIINGMTIKTAEGEVYVRQLWSVEGISGTGDCGAPYFATSNELGSAGKFIGIHAAGSDGYGPNYACAISRATIEKAIKALETGVRDLEAGDRDVIDTVSAPHHYYTSMTHILAPSENPAKIPSLAPVDVNNPDVYARASAKYNKTVRPDPTNLVRLKTCMSEYLQYCRNVETRPMKSGLVNFREACLGIPGTNFKGVDLSTSAGTPYNCMKLNKHDLIGQYVETGFRDGPRIEELYAEVCDNFRMLSRGEVPAYVYTDVIKSETLPKEKVAVGKGRLISCAPLTLVIVTRMLFGHFLTWMLDNHLSNGFAGGDNMEGDDAHLITLVHKTMSMDQSLSIAGDLSGYDTKHSADALRAGLEVITDFINHIQPMDALTMRIYQTYAKSMTTTCHLRGDQLHYWNGSLASGHPLTTCLNSVENHGLFMYSVWKARGFENGFFPKYFNNVVVRVLGDDNRASVSPAWKDYVSEHICAVGYADFGHVYTSDTKDGINDHFRTFEETTLLKRFTRYEPILGKYVAPLKLDVILELGLWTRSEGKERVPSKEQTIKNLDTMVKYLSFHEDKYWNEWIPRYELMHQHIGWKCKYTSRASCLRECHNSAELSFGSVLSSDV